MKLVVAHFSRQFLRPTETFIFNQIDNHINFSPIIVFKEHISKNVHADYLINKYPNLSLSNNNFYNNLKYKFLRLLSSNDKYNICRFIKENQAEILHFHYGTDAGLFLPSLKLINIPKIVSFYGYDCSSFPLKYFSLGKLYLKKRTFKYADVVLAMSPDMKKDLIKNGCPEEKIIVYYFGSSFKKFIYPDREYSERKTYTLLILATLISKKGHFDLFIAIKKLLDRGITNFKLQIVGSGPLENKLKRLAKKLEIDAYINFVGYVEYLSEQMINEIKNADIFVHPSFTDKKGHKEGIPTIIVEAMASGLPVISTYHAGIPSVINHNITGLLVKEHDTENLSNEIYKFMTNNTLRMQIGKNAQEYVISNLNLVEKEKELEFIYKQAIIKKNSNDVIVADNSVV